MSSKVFSEFKNPRRRILTITLEIKVSELKSIGCITVVGRSLVSATEESSPISLWLSMFSSKPIPKVTVFAPSCSFPEVSGGFYTSKCAWELTAIPCWLVQHEYTDFLLGRLQSSRISRSQTLFQQLHPKKALAGGKRAGAMWRQTTKAEEQCTARTGWMHWVDTSIWDMLGPATSPGHSFSPPPGVSVSCFLSLSLPYVFLVSSGVPVFSFSFPTALFTSFLSALSFLSPFLSHDTHVSCPLSEWL